MLLKERSNGQLQGSERKYKGGLMNGGIRELKLKAAIQKQLKKNKPLHRKLRADKEIMHTEQIRTIRLIDAMAGINPVKVIPGLPRGKYLLLDAVCEAYKENGRRGALVQDILTISGIPGPTVSRGLAKLEKEGLLRRKDAPSDRRETLVKPTAKGIRLHDKAEKIIQDTYTAALSKIGKEDLINMDDTLERLVYSLNREIDKRLTGEEAKKINEYMEGTEEESVR